MSQAHLLCNLDWIPRPYDFSDWSVQKHTKQKAMYEDWAIRGSDTCAYSIQREAVKKDRQQETEQGNIEE